MTIDPESTIYAYHYNEDNETYFMLTPNLEEAQQDPSYSIATLSDVTYWAAGNGEVFNGVIRIQEGNYIYIEDEENEVYTYVNVQDLSLEHKKESTFAQ
jgi:hypothetical protein